MLVNTSGTIREPAAPWDWPTATDSFADVQGGTPAAVVVVGALVLVVGATVVVVVGALVVVVGCFWVVVVVVVLVV
ncbi:MAG TPA: hypothetical protein VNV87_15090, partial [Acidimicrobiales bacterium]|nr:hypothetical protein [Acidimicrobiales bacterium]